MSSFTWIFVLCRLLWTKRWLNIILGIFQPLFIWFRFYFNCQQNHVHWIIVKMAFWFTLQQKHNNYILIKTSMDTMNYSKMMLMVDLISKRVHMAFGGMVLVMLGILEMIFTKESHWGLHIIKKMYFAHISFQRWDGYLTLVLTGIYNRMDVILQ